MRVYYHLHVSGFEEILFGEIDSEHELTESYKFRYRVYSDKGYIDSQKYKDGLEYDDYDVLKKSRYFIAMLDNRIIGFVRLIIDDPLPTELAFEFEEPKELNNISRKNRGEIGRLIVVPPDRENNKYLPRNIVTLFLLHTLCNYGLKNNILGGFSFIKKSLDNKLKKLKMPIGEINEYKQIYPKSGVLYNYFNQPHDPVIPIYFITNSFYSYLDEKIHNSKMFDINNNDYILKENLYNNFLRMLNII